MTTTADIICRNNRVYLSGEIDFSNVMSVYQKSLSLFDDRKPLVFNLSEVKNSNSAGLALMMEWLKQARATGQTIIFQQIPSDLFALARASGVDKLIPLAI
jgi:phospholipid transport system transporter-binding protein